MSEEKQNMPLAKKRDTWCESTKGLNLKEGEVKKKRKERGKSRGYLAKVLPKVKSCLGGDKKKK